jgi:hypothetical protein
VFGGKRMGGSLFKFASSVRSRKKFTREGNTPSKKEQGGKNPTYLSPRNKKACHSIVTALLSSVAKIETQSTMKTNRKTLNEFSPCIPAKTSKLNVSRSTSDIMIYTDITVRTQ